MKIKRWQLSLIVLLIFAFSGVCIYAGIQIFGGNKQETGKNKEVNTYENGWSKNIVAQIMDGDVPIPQGFEFVSGTKDTGLLIKDSKTNAQYLWVPMSMIGDTENTNYADKIFGDKLSSLSPELMENIQTYGGFYIGVSDTDNGILASIAGMTDEEYEQLQLKVAQLYGENSSVTSRLITKELLAGIPKGLSNQPKQYYMEIWDAEDYTKTYKYGDKIKTKKKDQRMVWGGERNIFDEDGWISKGTTLTLKYVCGPWETGVPEYIEVKNEMRSFYLKAEDVGFYIPKNTLIRSKEEYNKHIKENMDKNKDIRT